MALDYRSFHPADAQSVPSSTDRMVRRLALGHRLVVRGPSPLCIALSLWLLTAWLSTPWASAEELRLSAAQLVAQGPCQQVALSADGHWLELVRGRLYEDDGPASGYSYQPNEEKLRPETRIRKQLLVEDPRSLGVVLLVGSGGTLECLANGQPQKLESLPKVGHYWQQYALPPEALVSGSNRLELWGQGSVWIARDDEYAAGAFDGRRPPNRSQVSRDSGKTWTDTQLGTAGNVDGEYYVRLFLDQYQPSGWLWSPVVDLLNLEQRPLAPARPLPSQLTWQVDAESRTDSSVAVAYRTGSSLWPDAAHWTAWQTLAGSSGELTSPRGRFVQFRLELKTDDPRHSPRVKSLSLVNPADSAATTTSTIHWAAAVQISQLRNDPILRRSTPFVHEQPDQPQLQTLRSRYHLDDVVAGTASEWEQICRLAAWTSQRWGKMHLKDSYPPFDALAILAPHADGQPVGGFCQQYNLVFLQACQSFGLLGRLVSLGPDNFIDRIRGGHEAVEIWSNDHRQWVYVDADKAWYFVDRVTRRPLAFRELRLRQLAAFQQQPHAEVELMRLADKPHPWESLTDWPPFVELRLIPRSNFLAQIAPLPLNQGMRGWFWTGHEVWTDQVHPAARLYGQRISVPSQWDWSCNLVELRLLSTATPGEVQVALASETPHLKSIVWQVDEQPARVLSSADALADPLSWKLNSGDNRLSVRSVNSAGRLGPPSIVALRWQPESTRSN